MSCLKNILKFKIPLLCIKFCSKQMIKKKIKKLLSIFNSGLKDLEKEIKNMSKIEKEIENPDNIIKVVKKILEINKQNQQNQQNQEGKG